MNLVLGLLMLGGGAAVVWAGITDPEGGVLAGIGNALNGQPNTKHTSTISAAVVQNVAALAGSGASTAGGTTTTATAASGSPAASGVRASVLTEARTWLGTPYRWGGTSRSGVDCSGYTQKVFATVGVHLPRVSAAQQTVGVGRSLATAQPGDLVFFGVPAHHVGIYYGGNRIIHAPHTGARVRVETIWKGETITVRDVLSGKSRAVQA